MLWKVAICAFVADQASKWAVLYWLRVEELGKFGEDIPFVTLHLGWNRGINFGLFSQSPEWTRWTLVVISLIICVAVFYMVKKTSRPIVLASGGLILGGALGNIFDRLVYGAVVDFLNVSCCGVDNPFIFNVADIAIFAGAIGLLIYSKDEI